MYPKLVLNILKVMGGPTPIYTPLGTQFKEASIEASMNALTKETSQLILNDDANNDVGDYVDASDDVGDYVGANDDESNG